MGQTGKLGLFEGGTRKGTLRDQARNRNQPFASRGIARREPALDRKPIIAQ